MKTCVVAKILLSATVLAGSELWGGERITSLECWGKRAAHDFTADSVRLAKSVGFTGIFLNGGSGIGPDQIPLELALTNGVLPRLAPYTVKGNMDELRRRNDLLRQEGLSACGVCGASSVRTSLIRRIRPARPTDSSTGAASWR